MAKLREKNEQSHAAGTENAFGKRTPLFAAVPAVSISLGVHLLTFVSVKGISSV